MRQGWAGHFKAGPLRASVRKTDRHNSDNSVADTLGLMVGHANRAMDSGVIEKAIRNAGITNKDNEDEVITKVFKFIQSRVTFCEDEAQLRELFEVEDARELLINPEVLLSMQQPMGDCDDFSMLACSMLRNLGVKCDFVTVAADNEYPNKFTHVYCMVTKTNGEVIGFDSSHGKYPGWETTTQLRKQIWPFVDYRELGGDVIVSNKGMGAIDWNSIVQGAFTTAEKIGLQVTQQPGYQQVGPNGQSMSYINGNGGAGGVLNFPGTSVGSLSGTTIAIGVVGLLALFMFAKK